MHLRWGRIYALAKLSYKEAVRRRVVWVFLSILVLYLFPARWFFQEKPEDELKSIIGVTTRGMNVQLIAVGLLLAAFSIPTDIKNLTIHTIVTKPVERFEIVLGRFFGYLGLITIALVLMTVFGLLLINAGNLSHEAEAESMRARVARYGDMEFRSKKAADFTGVDVGREDVYRRYIAGHPQSSQRAVWSFKSVPDRFGKMEYVPLEFAFDVYRTTKGEEGAGVQVTFEVLTHSWNPTRKIDDPLNPGTQITMQEGYDREEKGLTNAMPGGANWAKVDALAERYGRYVYKNWQIFDYHTSAIPLPPGLFRNAAIGTPEKDGLIQGGTPQTSGRRLQVLVKCETSSQFVGAAKYDLYLLEADDSFSLNYFKGAFGIWFRLVIALTIAIAISTYLAGPLSFLVATLLFVGGFFREFLQEDRARTQRRRRSARVVGATGQEQHGDGRPRSHADSPRSADVRRRLSLGVSSRLQRHPRRGSIWHDRLCRRDSALARISFGEPGYTGRLRAALAGGVVLLDEGAKSPLSESFACWVHSDGVGSMANIYQQAAKRRKLIYFASIGVLLILSLVVRGTFFGIDRRTVDEVNASSTLALTLDGRAKAHELTELQQGDKELGGTAIQLMLTGSRAWRSAHCGTTHSTNRRSRNGTNSTSQLTR